MASIDQFIEALGRDDIMECERLISEEGVDVTFRTENRKSLIHLSSRNSNTTTLDWILSECGKTGMSIEDVDEHGFTPLAFSIKEDKLDNCRWLLEKGANMAVRTKDERNSLHVSSQCSKNAETLDWVLTEGLKVGLSIEDINEIDATALVYAVIGDELDNCRWLLEKGANVAVRMKNDRTLLRMASQLSKNADTLDWVLTEGLKVGLSIEDIAKDGFTPLLVAVAFGKLEIVKLLLARGAGLNARSNKGFNVLHACSRNGHSNVLEYLLEVVPIVMLNEKEAVLCLAPVLICLKLKHFDCVRLLATKALQVRDQAIAAEAKAKKDKAAAEKAEKTCCSCGITFGVVIQSCACFKKIYCSTVCQAADWSEHKAECIMWRREMREADRDDV